MAKSLLFFDIDGTLMSEKTHIISQNTLNALKKTQENEHLIIINTGRPYSTISPQFKSIHYDGIICGCGTYIELNNKVIFHLKAFVKGVRGYFSYYLRRFSLCFCLNNAFQSVLSSQTATMVKKHFDFIICFALLNHKNSIRFIFLRMVIWGG